MNKYASHVVAAVLTLWCVAPASAACPEIPPVARTPSTGSPFDPGNKGVTKLDTQTSDNVRITGGCVDVPQLFVNGINVEADVSYGVPWSSLGVLADGTTDNTAALNALPTGVRITADCAAGSTIRVNSPWLLKSNLDIKFLPGCSLVSYVSGLGSFAIAQADDTIPLTNVKIDGINISKSAVVFGERILRVWIDNFRLLNWTFTSHAGAMFLRGSCQEVAYGRSVDVNVEIGSPGIRHIGNVPLVVAGCVNQPADVWIHDNNIISGDAVYQACQPQSTGNWTNVSTDGVLYERNGGKAHASTYALVGAQWQDGTAAIRDYSCTDISYKNNTGNGAAGGILVSASGTGSLGPPLTVTNVRFSNQTLSAIDDETNSGTVHLRAKDGGTIDGVTFSGISLIDTNSSALTINAAQGTTDGVIRNVLFQNGVIETPNDQTQPALNWAPTVNLYSAENITFQGNVIGGGHLGASYSMLVGQDDNAGNPRTVTNLKLIGNLFKDIPDTSTAVELRNVAGADITGNTFRAASGATTITGIKMTNTSASGPGTTNTIITGNILSGLTTPLDFKCNSSAASVAMSNIGDGGTTCP